MDFLRRRGSSGKQRVHSTCKDCTRARGGQMSEVGPPNGSRLSCGAKLECSQIEFYNTASKTLLKSLRTGADSFKRLLGSGPLAARSGPWLTQGGLLGFSMRNKTLHRLRAKQD